ncbi:hypothetical protein VTN77DRAFT_9516 [Rasamsonia byssochlamydoides]|uniref:uncharacterized protein n=1 Tax=Rasamsonia byssochlamydoides TaxID=89139 RepID=UPI003742462A
MAVASIISSSLDDLREWLQSAWSLTSWKAVLLIFAIANLKSLPLGWHFRIFYYFFRNLRYRADKPMIFDGKPPVDAKGRPTHPIFGAATIVTRTSLLETDYNIHKSNSTYFADLDVSRTALMSRLYSPGMGIVSRELDQELSESDGSKPLKKKKKLPIYIALGSVYCTFKRELKPYEKFEIRSQIVAWDEKWLYILSYFLKPEKKRSEGSGPTLAAVAVSKYVIKKGRLTVRPERVFRASGFLPPRPDGDGATATPDSDMIGTPASSNSAQGITTAVDGSSLVREVLKLSADQVPAQEVLERQQKENSQSWSADEWTWERIEQERQRGLELIQGYVTLDAKLHDEWNNL